MMIKENDKKSAKRQFPVKKIFSILLVMMLMTTAVVGLVGCKEKPYEATKTHAEIFDIQGEKIKNADTVFYKYTGEQFKYTVDFVITDTGERFECYDEFGIDISIFNPKTGERSNFGGGWQYEEFLWPSEIGWYEVNVNYTSPYITLENGKEYKKYRDTSDIFDIIIEE